MSQKIQGKQINPEFSDDRFKILGSADATKQVSFEVDGLTTSTTRTITIPDNSGTLALTSDIAGGTSIFDEKVGSGETFTTVRAALIGGSSPRKIIINTDVTETIDWSLSGTNWWVFQGAGNNEARPKITFGTTQIDYIATNSTLEFRNLELDFTYTVLTLFINAAFNGNQVIFDNCIINNNSTIADCRIVEQSNLLVMKDCIVNLPNVSGGGIYDMQTARVVNTEFVGGGALCEDAIELTSNMTLGTFSGLEFSGTYNASGVALNTVNSGAIGLYWDNIYISSSSATEYQFEGTFNGGFLNIFGNYNLSTGKFSDIDFQGGDIELAAGHLGFSNCKNMKITTWTAGAGSRFSGCNFSGVIQATFDDLIFSGCYFGNVIQVAGSDNILSGCRLGNLFTDNGTNTIIRGCTPEADNNPNTDGIPRTLGTVTGINFFISSADVAHTVTTGKTAVVTGLILRVTTTPTTITVDASAGVEVGVSSLYDIISDQTLIGFGAPSTTQEAYYLTPAGGAFRIADSAENIYFRRTAATGTGTFTVDIDLIGYEF